MDIYEFISSNRMIWELRLNEILTDLGNYQDDLGIQIVETFALNQQSGPAIYVIGA